MTASTIYSRMKAVADPILKHYRTDLTVHDRKIGRAMMPGDVGIYAVRESGTHFALYRSSEDTESKVAADRARRAIEYIDAILSTGCAISWFLVECTSPQRGTVSPVSFAAARNYALTTHQRMLTAPRQLEAA